MAKAVPERQCIGCMNKKSKNELLRIVRTPEGTYMLDASGRANGRGAYICHNKECLEEAIRKHSLDRTFRETVSPETYEKLRGEIESLG